MIAAIKSICFQCNTIQAINRIEKEIAISSKPNKLLTLLLFALEIYDTRYNKPGYETNINILEVNAIYQTLLAIDKE